MTILLVGYLEFVYFVTILLVLMVLKKYRSNNVGEGVGSSVKVRNQHILIHVSTQ